MRSKVSFLEVCRLQIFIAKGIKKGGPVSMRYIAVKSDVHRVVLLIACSNILVTVAEVGGLIIAGKYTRSMLAMLRLQ